MKNSLKPDSSGSAWVVTVNMGYGHQRTSYPLKELAFGNEIINANSYPGIPEKDRLIWKKAREFYEFVSRFKRFPLIGRLCFGIFNRFQIILNYYPKRDLSRQSFQLKQIFSLIKKGWGKHLVDKLKKKNLPLISTFFTPAFMGEIHGYPGEIYCLVCDADISRTWVPLEPAKSRIKYFAPTNWVVNRLNLYGVKKENIFLTGYPLPEENLGSENLEVLKEDLSHRLLNLDPDKSYFRNYSALIEKFLGNLPFKSNHPLTLMFAVGGAGLQKEIGMEAANSLKEEIKSGKVRLILSAGIRKKVKEYFEKKTRSLPVRIIFGENIEEYFEKFNLALRTADILWTKPSELSFYSALGLPIIIAPPVGSQEDFNKKWLLTSGFGIEQENPKHVRQWLFDFLKSGRFAEAAMEGFVEGEKLARFRIEKIISR